MGLFDRFKKRPPEPAPKSQWPKPPKEDTMALLLMDRVLESIDPAIEHLQKTFGDQSVGDIDRSHPQVPAFTVTVDGLEFWCSYLPMPVPKEDRDIAAMAQYDLFLGPEEQEAFRKHKSFWVIAQKGAGKTLEGKRRACWDFSLVCAALLELEGAVGASVTNTALLVSKASYLSRRAQMEEVGRDDPDWFPVPLWVWSYRGLSEEKPTIQTQGLAEFGLPELGFFDPELPAQDILNYLFTMASWQITGKQLYRDMALIPLTEETEVVSKQDAETIFFIGG
ncbi:hypothetical protein D7V91_10550 [bacterium 1xD42-67]|nr:hypothetical protein D7V91_10550 [bacterium 1xD42-67]